jgi:PHD/YefM family antitoxin component YafN of YafNO toxin-antitoxin module
MRTVSENDAVVTLPSIIDELGSESVAIERDGKDVAVLMSPVEYESTRRMKIKRLVESMDRIATSV